MKSVKAANDVMYSSTVMPNTGRYDPVLPTMMPVTRLPKMPIKMLWRSAEGGVQGEGGEL